MNYEINESRVSRYGVDPIGQIDANLTLLRGYGVMALELIQNADDARATEMSLDVTETALIVRNNAEFRSCADRQSNICLRGEEILGEMCDWHAFSLISSGAKSERAVTTTGRFGLGFTSVFQITDTPKVECDGSKLTINPDQDSGSWERVSSTQGTVFTLPWAFDGSAPVRKRLKNVGVVTRDSLSQILKEINETSADSLVFLKNLKKISILNNGKVKSVYTREYEPEKNRLTIEHQPSSRVREYFYVSTEFSNALSFLETKFPRDLGEKNRRHGVEIAIPREFDSSKSGLIYAYLPTERNTLMPLSINGDFYPDSSRKDIILNKHSGNDALSEWNRTIIESSAELFIENLDEIYLFLGYKYFWLLIQAIFDLNKQIDAYGSDISDSFAAFWSKFGLYAGELQIIPIEGNEEESRNVLNSSLLEGNDVREKRQAVKILRINAPSHKIKNQFHILRDLGIDELNFNIVVEALSKAQWVMQPSETILASDPKIQDRYIPIYTLLDSYVPKESASVIVRDSLVKYRSMPILISHARTFMAPRDLYFTENIDIQNLAIDIDSKTMFLDSEIMKFTRIRDSCKEFKVEDAVHLIESALKNEEITNLSTIQSIHRLLTLVCGGKKLSDYDLENLMKLKVWPTTDGTLISAQFGMIPGDFSDPLGDAEIIDISKLEKKARDFLIDVLDVKVLRLESYVDEILPKVFLSGTNSISPASYRQLLEELSRHHKKFENTELVLKMQSLHFIPTEFGGFMKIDQCAIGSALDKTKLNGIFESWFAPAYLPESKVVRQFLDSLGMPGRPNPKILEKIVRSLTSETQNQKIRQKVIRIVDYLLDKKNSYPEPQISSFVSSLSATGFLPAKGDFEYWYSPGDLLSPDVEDMVSPQQHLKILDICGVDIALMDNFIQKCGIGTEPDVRDVVAHVRHCASSGVNVQKKVLRYLNKAASKQADETIGAIRSLREVAFLPSPDGKIRPADLYTHLHKIGAPWAYLLPKNLDFPDLFNALGIKHSPDGDDLIRILTEVKDSHYASGDLHLSDQRLAAYLQCWELLNDLCAQERIDDSQKAKLKNSSLFLNYKCEFKSESYLFIPDSEWFRTEFENDFGEFFILDDHVYPKILNELEFRLLSLNIEASLSTIEGSITRHERLMREIVQRAHNIEAALSSIEGPNENSMGWTSLDVYQAGSIQVEWALRFENQHKSVIKSGNVFADFENHKLYISEYLSEDDNQVNWARMFRELFEQLFPSASKENLVGLTSLVSMIMDKSPESGLKHLIDVGAVTRPREASIDFSTATVKEVELGHAGDEIELQSQPIYSEEQMPKDSQAGEDADFEDDSTDGNHPDSRVPGLQSSEHRDRTQSPQKADFERNRIGSERDPKSESARPRQTEQRKYSDMQKREIREAYIYIEKESSPDGVEAQKSKMDSEDLSRRIVVEHEKAEGRHPEEMSTDNPGYDIESTGPNGDIRFIEIKSTKSLWGKDGITLSNAQLNLAYIKKDAFWLYVVENIGSAQSRIYKIQNPAKHIRGFKLNDAWKEIALSLEYSLLNEDEIGETLSANDVGTRILHVERGECWLIGWEQIGVSVKVTLLFDHDDQHIVFPLNTTKMKKLNP
jgi:hypothetical protein